MTGEHTAIKKFEDWYDTYAVDERTGLLEYRNLTEAAEKKWRMWEKFKREQDARVSNYYQLEMLADGEVISRKEDLPNISSGETSGLVRRMARNLVQNVPNVEVISVHDDDSTAGIFARHILLTKIIGSDTYSNDMQQNLFASTKTAFTIGFDCVVPVLLQDSAKSWYVKYDNIHYRDVFPEPGVKDIRESTSVFVRRYLTKGDVKALIQTQPEGWDIAALKGLLQARPPTRREESQDHQSKKHRTLPDGYEIITWYSNSGDHFLTFAEGSKELLRIEHNLHPLNWHPVHFLVLEKDALQPLGKSQVELLLGRQEFQDLLFNGAMKQYYRNINPSIIGYGPVNAMPNLSPGKFTNISNPNTRIEPFEVNTQTLLQFGAITQQNVASMVQIVGAPDQQMAVQANNGGMSATPQGVEAQTAMIDITTNNYQKAIESFFSHYCAYGLTLYFHELDGVEEVTPSADARKQLINAGIPAEAFADEGKLKIDFKDLAVEYFVRVVPGSLVEMEDEKQLRILQQLLVPIAQAMPAFAQANDPALLANAAQTIQYIMEKSIELSGSSSSKELSSRFKDGVTPQLQIMEQKNKMLEDSISDITDSMLRSAKAQSTIIEGLKGQLGMQSEALSLILEKLGVGNEPSAPVAPQMPEGQLPVAPASVA